MPQNVRVTLLVLLCFFAVHGPNANGHDIANLVTQLCDTRIRVYFLAARVIFAAQRHQGRLDAVTCLGAQTKSEFPGNLAKCVRTSFKAVRPLKDFGLGALCGPFAPEGLDRAAPVGTEHFSIFLFVYFTPLCCLCLSVPRVASSSYRST
ncbi:hypothetical protein V5799_031580 [Amblyomma americanum]|uniref:Secreted protein n=1 Tax=Amblyomma americanum TaxID=6943 RepID=A0AAQ4DTN4_AMBAM